jgi:hypothetical protein
VLLRYAGYLLLFLVGLVAVPNVVMALIGEPYARPAGELSLVAYILGFCYWTRRREARLLGKARLLRGNRTALFGLSVLGVALGGLVVLVSYPLVPDATVHPWIAPVVVAPLLLGVGAIAGGVWAFWLAMRKPPSERADEIAPNR